MALVKTASEVTNSIIGENSFFSGRFFINGSLKIDGKFEGPSLKVDQLYIGPTGKVKTSVQAASVIVEGMIIGNIIARNRVMLLPTARIFGDIRTPELIIQNGVILEGRCMISHDLKHSASEYIGNEYSRDNLSLEKIFGASNGKRKAS